MACSLNKVIMIGKITKDPEIKRTSGGRSVTTFTVAMDRNYRGQNQDTASSDFINCVAWSSLAESVSRYCSKGSLVAVEGKLQSRTFNNQQGQKVFVVEVCCDSVQFLDAKNSQSNSQDYRQTDNYSRQREYQNGQQPSVQNNYDVYGNQSQEEENIPF